MNRYTLKMSEIGSQKKAWMVPDLSKFERPNMPNISNMSNFRGSKMLPLFFWHTIFVWCHPPWESGQLWWCLRLLGRNAWQLWLWGKIYPLQWRLAKGWKVQTIHQSSSIIINNNRRQYFTISEEIWLFVSQISQLNLKMPKEKPWSTTSPAIHRTFLSWRLGLPKFVGVVGVSSVKPRGGSTSEDHSDLTVAL